MLALFKGELEYETFMRHMTYKEMVALRDARVEQLLKEHEEMERSQEEQNRQTIRNNILAR